MHSLVFYKPYESRGQAWPITFNRLVWGVVMFQLFMTGIFILRKKTLFWPLMPPLIGFTLYWAWTINRDFEPLSSFVSLSAVFEVQRGEATNDVAKLKAGHPVTPSQRSDVFSLGLSEAMLTILCSNLNRRRYAQNDETLYVAPEELRTDYVCQFYCIHQSRAHILALPLVSATNGQLVLWGAQVGNMSSCVVSHLPYS